MIAIFINTYNNNMLCMYSGENAINWKKGWYLENGYVRMFKPEHPMANKKGCRLSEMQKARWINGCYKDRKTRNGYSS